MKWDFFPSVSLNKDFSLLWCSAVTDNVYSANKHLLKPARYYVDTDLQIAPRQSFFFFYAIWLFIVLSFTLIMFQFL